jgi:hypothetical protein
LLFNSHFEVVWAMQFMAHEYAEELDEYLPGYDSGASSSFWIRRIARNDT